MRSDRMGKASVEYGNVAALHRIAERVELIDIVNSYAPKMSGTSVGHLVEIMAINRAVDPLAKIALPEWYQTTYLPELLGVKLPIESGYKTLTRCYDYLTDDVQMDIEIELARKARKEFGLEETTYLYDITSTFVEGEGEADILQFGYSRDSRPDRRQVNYGLVVTREWRIPLFHQAFPGNMNDSKTVKSTMNTFHEELGLQGCMVVDRIMVTASNIVDIVDSKGLDLVGALRLNSKLKKLILGISMNKYKGPFMLGKEAIQFKELPLDLGGKKRRCILYYSEEKAKRDTKAREQKLKRVEKELEDIEKKLTRKGRGRKTRKNTVEKKVDKLLSKLQISNFIGYRFVGGRGGRRLKWWREEKALKEAKYLDGKYILVTTLTEPPDEILRIYRSRNGIERASRITKESIRIRPIFNRKEQHIKAHLFICFIAYLLVSLLEMVLRKKGHKITAEKALKKLRLERCEIKRMIDTTSSKRILKSLGIGRAYG